MDFELSSSALPIGVRQAGSSALIGRRRDGHYHPQRSPQTVRLLIADAMQRIRRQRASARRRVREPRSTIVGCHRSADRPPNLVHRTPLDLTNPLAGKRRSAR
jgi:hypothetical protein